MKKLMTAMAVCTVASLSLVADTGVTSANVVGYQTVTVRPGYNLFSLGFEQIGGGRINIQNVFSTNGLTAGYGISSSDQILLWNGSVFEFFFYRAYKASPPNQFVDGPAWVKSTSATTVATNTIPAGTGFWLSHYGATTNTLTVAAQVVAAATNAFTLSVGYNMIGSAFPVAFSLNAGSPFNWANATAGYGISSSDQILLWNGSAFDFYFYRAYKASPPNQFVDGPAWVKSTSATTVTTDSIPAGSGFWYVKYGAGTNIVQTTPLN